MGYRLDKIKVVDGYCTNKACEATPSGMEPANHCNLQAPGKVRHITDFILKRKMRFIMMRKRVAPGSSTSPKTSSAKGFI